MNSSNKVYKRNPHIVYRNIGNEAILVPTGQLDTELGYIYSLNEVAARVWELLDGIRSFAQILQAIQKEFEVDEQTLEKDMAALINDFRNLKLIE